MMKIAGFGLLGLAALMVIPSGVSAGAAPMMYGIADIELRDADGNVKLAQTVHNQLTDEGEERLIDQVFDTGDIALTGADRVHDICLLSTSHTDYSESTHTLDTTFDGPALSDNYADRRTCAGNVTDNGSAAQIGPVTFTADPDFNAGETISGFMVCGANNGSNCRSAGGAVLGYGYGIAAVDINDVTLPNSGDSLTVTYTFDISTPTA